MVASLTEENQVTQSEPLRDRNGWICTDHRLPPNRAMVLIWNKAQGAVQFAEFMMYSCHRYEFIQGSAILSIHAVTHWQFEPQPPDPAMWGNV